MPENKLTSEGLALLHLTPPDVTLATPLEWSLLSADGDLLFEAGTVVPDETMRGFLFSQFDLYRAADKEDVAPEQEKAPTDDLPISLDDLGLMIGGRIGLRNTIKIRSPMYTSRMIGFSNPRHNNERSLFISQPVLAGFGSLDLMRGEQVELVALTGKGVFRFVCTVEVTSRDPFHYVILSAPGIISQLRERKFSRMSTCLAARFAPERATDDALQLARISDISPYGMSMIAIAPQVQHGDRLRVLFRFNVDNTDIQIDTIAIVRRIDVTNADTNIAAYGLEFADMEPSRRIALKAFMAEHG